MLVELSKMEQRDEALREVVTNALSIGEVAATFGVSRQSTGGCMRGVYEHTFDKR